MPFATHTQGSARAGEARGLLGLVLGFCMPAGCTPAGPPQAPVPTSAARSIAARAEHPAPAANWVDWGPRLADGRDLHHAFTLVNTSDRPWRIVRAEALTPCCSAVGSVSETIAPGHSASIPVVFRPGRSTGRKQVEFQVVTDDSTQPLHRFGLAASFQAEIEVQPDERNASRLPVHAAGRHRYTVIRRRPARKPDKGNAMGLPARTPAVTRVSDPSLSGTRTGGESQGGNDTQEGRSAPATVSATPPLAARFVGTASQETLADGWVLATRELEVDLPAQSAVGVQRGEVTLSWADGRTLARPVTWEVVPRIRVNPASLLIRSDPSQPTAPFCLTIQSDDRPFRILAIQGAHVDSRSADLPTDASRRHVLDARLDPAIARANADQIQQIRLTTDHPDQPEVALPVLLLPQEQEHAP